jgi:allantoinase
MPRGVFQPTHGRAETPDLPNFSWAEYGLRCGVPRIIKALTDRELPASNFMSASLPEHYPSCAEAALKTGWEVMGHSIYQRSIRLEADEEATIVETKEKLLRFCGYAPRGWLAPGASETERTPELLKKHGFEFLFEWQFDDLPCWMYTAHGPLIAMPFTIELNDIALIMHGLGTDEWLRRFEAVLETFSTEVADQPRVITLSIHPHISAVPLRFPTLLRILDALVARDDTVFMTGGQIADWFTLQEPVNFAANCG